MEAKTEPVAEVEGEPKRLWQLATKPVKVVVEQSTCGHRIANVEPLAWLAFGITTEFTGLFYASNITEAGSAVPITYAITYGGLALLLAAMWEAKRGNSYNFAIFLTWAAFYMGFGLLKICVSPLPGFIFTEPDWSGWRFWNLCFGLLVLIFLVSSKNLVLVFLWFTFAAFFIIMLIALHSHVWTIIAGWFLMGTGVFAIYLGAAMLTKDTYKANILPIGAFGCCCAAGICCFDGKCCKQGEECTCPNCKCAEGCKDCPCLA